MGLDPTEPSSGGTEGFNSKFQIKVASGVIALPENIPIPPTNFGYKSLKHVLSSTGQVNSDPPPVFVLC